MEIHFQPKTAVIMYQEETLNRRQENDHRCHKGGNRALSSAGPRFKSRTGDRISWPRLFVVFLYPRQYRTSTSP
jgi:hypothetical protein